MNGLVEKKEINYTQQKDKLEGAVKSGRLQ